MKEEGQVGTEEGAVGRWREVGRNAVEVGTLKGPAEVV